MDIQNNTLREEILSNYADLDTRIVNFIDGVIEALRQTDAPITAYTKLILVMLVSQLILYFKASDSVLPKSVIINEDKYTSKKLPEISILQKTHDQIVNLLDKISLSPLSAAKVKKLSENTEKEEAPAIFKRLVSQ